MIEAFVKAGALDSFQVHRASLFKAIDTALDLGSSLQKTRDDNQVCFADLLGQDSQVFTARKVTYPDEPPWHRLQELKYEKDTIGFFVTGHPLDDFEIELKTYTTATIAEIHQPGAAKEVYLGAEVVAVREIFTRRGDRMAFATLEDTSGQIDAVIFSDIYVEGETSLKSGEPIWVKGQVENSEGTAKLILSKKSHAKILPLRHAYETLAREMHLHLDAPLTGIPVSEEKLKKLQGYLKAVEDKNGVPLFLHICLKGRCRTTLRMKEAVPLKRDTVNFLKDMLKEEKVRIDFR